MLALVLILNFAQAQPQAHADSRECVKNIEEFRKSDQLTKLLGKDYDPFFKWTGTAGTELVNEKGSMWVKIPAIGHIFGYKDSPVPLEVCAENGKAFVMSNGRRFEFNDPQGNSMTLADNGHSATFKRVLREPAKAN